MSPLEGGGPMYEFVMTLFWVIGSIFVLLVLVIVIGKARRGIADARMRRRRAELEPALFRYLAREGEIDSFLPRPLRRGDRDLVERILFDLRPIVKGRVHERAREAFERLGFVDHHIGRLVSRSWWTRAEAAEKLGLMASDKGTRPLVRLMGDPVGEVRVRAARALGSIRTSDALKPLVEALDDPGRWSAIRVAGILIGAGDEGVACILERFERMPHHAKIAAIDIIGRIRSLKAMPLLHGLLSGDQADIRARAAFALGFIGDPNSASHLIEALQDPSWAVRAMAAKALGRLREERSIPALCAALSDRQWWVRANAAEGLKNKGYVGVKALLEMLDAKDAYAAQQAVQMLQESGVLDGMISRLGSEDGGERQQALEVMAKLVKLRRTDLLTEMAHNHPEASIRQRLAIILGMRLQPEPVS